MPGSMWGSRLPSSLSQKLKIEKVTWNGHHHKSVMNRPAFEARKGSMGLDRWEESES